MKKSIMIMALTALLTFFLIGTAMAHPLGEDEAAWDVQAAGYLMDNTSHSYMQSQSGAPDGGRSLGEHLWGFVQRLTCHQIDRFTGCRANLVLSLQSLFATGRENTFMPRIAIEFSL